MVSNGAARAAFTPTTARRRATRRDLWGFVAARRAAVRGDLPPWQTLASPATMAEPHDHPSTDALTAALYDRLRRAAQACLRHGSTPTLQPTALLHEAYCKLAASERAGWKDEEHFLATAATAMRQIITDHARSRRAHKRSGGERVALTDLDVGGREAGVDLVALDDVLAQLASVAPDLARLVELRSYAGLSMAQIAAVQGTSLSTVEKAWKRARAWLSHALERFSAP